MRDPMLLVPRQRTLTFTRQELWDSLPDEQRVACRKLCVQLVRTVLEIESETRRSHERKDS
jgi:hypothetical protein